MNWLQKTSNTVPEGFLPREILDDMNLLYDERQHIQGVTTPGSLVKHDKQGWTGKVVKVFGDPVNDGKILVEHEYEGQPAQRFYSALELTPVMKMTSPFPR